ncbi:MAG: hypothetical protein KGH53_01735 [Candidatus Micrarchaeota archaeon]|nr:hypothetical protein [Candidatus Micrarchaeota archaeon]
MGLFDYVLLSFKCPNCGEIEKHHEWQTKAFDRVLSTYKPGQVAETDDALIKDGKVWIHTVCKNCNKPIQARVVIKNYKLTSKIDYASHIKKRRKLSLKLAKTN